MEHIRYSVAACQVDMPNPIERKAMRANTDRMLSMVDSAVAGAAPFLPVRLAVFPEFGHSAPVFETGKGLPEKIVILQDSSPDGSLELQAREHSSYSP